MPVPAAITDLSTTPSSNSPAGTETPASTDDYLRTHAAFIRQNYNTGVTNAATAAAALPKAGGEMTGPINEARAIVASHATTADIWAAAGNAIDWTGTATTTTFPAAPQAGAKRRLHCAAGCSFTHSATLDIVGSASFTATAGDIVDVEAITTTTFRIVPIKDDGTPVALPAASATVAGAVELATTAETQAGTDTARAVTPAGLAASSFGMQQGWQSVTGSRALSTTYTNSTGRPIQVAVFGSATAAGNPNVAITVGGVVAMSNTVYTNSAGYSFGVTATVPPGGTYSVTMAGATLASWTELR